MAEAPNEIIINGSKYHLANDEWADRRITLAQCERAARRLPLAKPASQVIQEMMTLVVAEGPIHGGEVVTKRADYDPTLTAERMSWTDFLKYNCQYNGMLRYKKISKKGTIPRGSRVYYATVSQVLANQMFSAPV